MVELEVGDIVMCVVERIVGTTVFVKIDEHGEGSIILSEVAPGRIRNLRDYVVPKKRIVCKVLRISGDRIDLSLRRVTQKEKKEIFEIENEEKSCKSVLKSILGNNAENVINEIAKKESVYDFCEKIKIDTSELEKFVNKKDAQKVQEILKKQKQKKTVIKKEISLTSQKPNGVTMIKEILGKIKDIEVKYISAGKYVLKTESQDPKAADHNLRIIIEGIEKQAKQKGLTFSIVKK